MGTRLEWAFLLVATLCITLMPSIYRGGASMPHAHGLFQFWLSGPERAFDHHHSNLHAGEHDNDAHAVASAAATSISGSDAVERGVTDEPRVSPLNPPGGSISTIALAVMTLFAIGSAVSSRWRMPTWLPSRSGRVCAPEPPPPQFSAVV